VKTAAVRQRPNFCFYYAYFRAHELSWVTNIDDLKRPWTGPAEPVRSVRPWPDQLFGKIIKFLFLLRIFQGAWELQKPSTRKLPRRWNMPIEYAYRIPRTLPPSAPRHTLALMCAKNHLLIFSSFLDIWENVEWPRFFGPPCRGSAGAPWAPQRGLGRSPSRNRIWRIITLKYEIWW